MRAWFGTLMVLVACSAATEGPRSGEWSFDNAEVVSNACRFPESDVIETGTFNLRTDEANVEIALPDTAKPITCTSQDSVIVTCIDDSVDKIAADGVTITVGTELEAVFFDEESGEVMQTLDGNCSGALCAVAASAIDTSFP